MALIKMNHTQISNSFIDSHMQHVSGSATKVFLAISRKTTWNNSADCSISQMCEITGISNRAVIKAVRELEKRDLIAVTRESGKENIYSLR